MGREMEGVGWGREGQRERIWEETTGIEEHLTGDVNKI